MEKINKILQDISNICSSQKHFGFLTCLCGWKTYTNA